MAVLEAAGFGSWQRSEKVVFVADYGHAFAQPSPQSLRVSDLVAGNILQLVAKRGRFLQVRYPDGRLAYVPAAQTMPYGRWVTRKNPDAEQIIAIAQTMLGVPYLWGGTSTKGVDCSGFTEVAFFLNGIVLPRDASQQSLVGEEVDIRESGVVSPAKCLQNLRPSDLLFLAPRGNPMPRRACRTLRFTSGRASSSRRQGRCASTAWSRRLPITMRCAPGPSSGPDGF